MINLKTKEGQAKVHKLLNGTGKGVLQRVEMLCNQNGAKHCGIQSTALIWAAGFLL